MSAIIAVRSFLNHSSTPNSELFKSGPERSTLFKEIPWCCALESNTTRICPGFCGWYTPKMGKYQHSSSSWIGGAFSAWWFWKSYFMKAENCSFISGFLLSARRKELRRDKACSRLFGSDGLGDLNGKGTTQFFCSSWWTFACMIFLKEHGRFVIIFSSVKYL